MAPVLDSAEQLVGMRSDDLSPNDRARLGSARIAASRLLTQAKAALFPDDEEGPGVG